MKKLIKESLDDLDQPINLDETNVSFLKKNKIRVIIRYEDGSHATYYAKLGSSYYITIKKRKYLIIPKCFSKGKNPTIEYYFNNPFPIEFSYESSKITPFELWQDPEKKIIPEDIKTSLASICVDSETLQNAFNSNWLKSMYAKPGLTTKSLLIIGGAIFIAILVILQVTGVVDVIGWIQGTTG